MAEFGWAYVDCSDVGSTSSGSEGPPYSLQFVTESGGATTGSWGLVYYTASYGTYAPSTVVLQGDMIVTGAISASTYHIEDIAVIDATGSTFFGDDGTDLHYRTGSLALYSGIVGSAPFLSASAIGANVLWTNGGRRYKYNAGNAAQLTILASDHIFGIEYSSATVVTIPSASAPDTGYGTVFVIKDCVKSRTGPGNNITLTGSPGSDVLIDGAGEYILTGTMPAISIVSNGVHWYVF